MASVTILTKSLQSRDVVTLVVILECCLAANIDSAMKQYLRISVRLLANGKLLIMKQIGFRNQTSEAI